jgi:hypothetical protein
MRATLAIALALMCAGCVSTNAAVLDSSVSYQKICPDGVQIFTAAERVPGPYQEVALLNSSGESGWTTEQGMAHSQQQKAAQLGANGIIMGDTKEPNAGTKIIGSILGTGAERKGKAVAIFIPSDSVRVQRVCKITPRALTTPYKDADLAVTTAPAGMGTAAQAEAPRVEPVRAEAPRAEPVSTSIVAPPAPTVVPVSAQASPIAVPTATQAATADNPDSIPLGARYVGDARIRIYYPVGCARQHPVPLESRVYFQTADGAARDGFVASGDC